MKEIPLTQGKVALVDDEDYERLVAMGKWQFGKEYAIKTLYFGKGENGKQIKKTILMHRIILNAKDGDFVDHKKGSRLNNQKENLRICTHANNMMNRKIHSNNSTGYKGVYAQKKTNMFYASISVDNKQIHLGTFRTPKEAAIKYNEAATWHYGEFANLNLV